MAASDAFAKLLATTLVVAPATRGTGQTLIEEWTPHPGASYYEGTISTGEAPARMRTTSHRLILRPGETAEIEAIGADGRRLGAVAKTARPAGPVPRSPEVLPSAVAEPTVVADPFGNGDLGDAAYGDAATGGETPAEDAPLPLAADAQPPRTVEPARLGVTLGIGKEWLEATGGVSEYDGSTNVGGIAVRAETRLGDGAWLGVAQLAAHNFTTTVTRLDEATDTTSEEDSKFLRTSARAGVFYDLSAGGDRAAAATLGLGIGIGLHRLPVLLIDDDVTGAAELEPRSVVGPVLGVYYARHLSLRTSAGAEASVMPLSFSNDTKGLSTNALLFWRNAFVARLFTELALVAAKETATVAVTCPVVSDCAEESTATSNLFAARLGIGMIF